MYHSIFREEGQAQLKQIGQADLVIGLPSYKNAPHAAHVAQVALLGAQQHYPQWRTVLVNADAGFDPATRHAIVTQATQHRFPVVSGRYTGALGRGNAIAATLDAALALDAKAIVILDSNNQTITPHWTAGLADLIFNDQADLVMPRYQWLLPDGALSDLIIYPMFRALWKQNIRHPAAPDFALSPQLAGAMLDEDIWETEVALWGLPLWLTAYSVLRDWRVAQSALGEKYSSTPIEPFQAIWPTPHLTHGNEVTRLPHLIPTIPAAEITAQQITQRILQSQPQFQHTMSVMFSLVNSYRRHWHIERKRHSISTLTRFASPTLHATTPELDPTLLLDNLALGWLNYRALWQKILTTNNLAHLESLAALPPDQFYFPTHLWTRIIYDFAVVFNRGEYDPWQITQALFPIYQGRLAAYWQEIAGLSAIGREGTVSAQALEFADLQPYLKLRWRTYE